MARNELLNSSEQVESNSPKGKYLIFSMGEESYGMDIRYITEIIGIQSIIEVPDMPQYIRGITNLRGKIIPVMDARYRFKKPQREYDDRTCIIVIETNETAIGLIVDSVSEVLTMSEKDIAPPPEINKRGRRNFVNGIGKTGDGVILIIDCKKLLSDDEVETLNAIA